MDSWDNEKFIIKVNDESMSETESNWRDHTSNKCGNSSWKERS